MAQIDLGADRLGVAHALPQGVAFHRAELAFVGVILGLLAATLAFDRVRPAAVDWPAFLLPIAASLAMVALGGFIRARRPMKRTGLFAIGFGIFMGFTAVVAVFIYLMFPFSRPTIDPALIAIDARMGYDWAGFVTWVSQWPMLGTLLGWVYVSAVPQLVLVIMLLAWTGQERGMQRFLAVGIIGMAVTVAIWWLFPSLGPTPFVTVPVEAGAKIGLVVDQAYADQLMRLANEGVAVIRPEIVMGVIAFPSFHIFMACLAVWFSRGTPVFPAILVLDMAMIPATLSHGGHHLIDVMAALVLFSLIAALMARLLPGR